MPVRDPEVIISDRYPRIDNEFFRILARLQGTAHRITTTVAPCNNEIINKLHAHCADPSQSQLWDPLVYAYNIPHSAHH